jgi:hypothetical protein
VVEKVALNTTLLMVTMPRVQVVQVVVVRGEIPQVNMWAAMELPAKEIKVETTSPTVALVQVVVALALLVEIQLALRQVQVAQEKHPSSREQLSLVVVVGHFVLEAIPLEPVALVEAVAVAQVHHLDLQNQMRQVVRNLEPQIPVAAVAQAYSKVLQQMEKVRRAEQVLWSFVGLPQASRYSRNQHQIQQLLA